jgi:predicted Zn-ribbon and HTH transcriptional regulator
MNCGYCGYEWENRMPYPKACPECKRRFTYKRAVIFKDEKKVTK